MTDTFDNALAGTKKGDEKTIEVTYPEDYVDTTIANETFSYEVSAQKVRICTGSEEVCLEQ